MRKFSWQTLRARTVPMDLSCYLNEPPYSAVSSCYQLLHSLYSLRQSCPSQICVLRDPAGPSMKDPLNCKIYTHHVRKTYRVIKDTSVKQENRRVYAYPPSRWSILETISSQDPALIRSNSAKELSNVRTISLCESLEMAYNRDVVILWKQLLRKS